MRSRVTSLLAGSCVAAAILLSPTATANAATGVDMRLACQMTNGAGWVEQLTYPSQGAYGWRCWVPPFGAVKKGVNVQLYCSGVYGLNAYNSGGAYSWYCA